MLCSMVCTKPFTINSYSICTWPFNCVEVRSVDPSANPYLAMAVILEAGLEGIRQSLTPPVAINRNIYVMSEEERQANGIENLPAKT